MKSKIIIYLVENEGFDIFSIEANMPEAYKLNKYVIKGEGNPKLDLVDRSTQSKLLQSHQ